MAQKKLPHIDEPSKRALIDKAKRNSAVQELARVADQALAMDSTTAWRTLSAEHCEIVLYRVSGGASITQITEEMGLDPGLIHVHAYIDQEFGHRLAMACEIGMHPLVDRLLTIPTDETLTSEQRRLLSDNIKWIASRVNRKAYSDRLQVDLRQATTYILPGDVNDL
ncbi:MAG: hypothetical protein ACSLE1_15810 [Sphingobium sp.]